MAESGVKLQKSNQVKYIWYQGRIQGAHPARASPKIGKNKIF
jgi:hypothetical protein